MKDKLEKMKKYAYRIRVLPHFQVKKMKILKKNKARLMGIQENGTIIQQKINYTYYCFKEEYIF